MTSKGAEDLLAVLQKTMESDELLEKLRLAEADSFFYKQLFGDAADAIEALRDTVKHQREIMRKYGGEAGIVRLYDYTKKYFELSAKMPRWISVEEKLPEPDDDSFIIGWFGGGKYDQLRYPDFAVLRGNGKLLPANEKHINGRCIAWYRLPDPPKEVNNEDALL